MTRKRVAVTGVGTVSPLGVGTESTWKSLVSGESGAGPVTRFDATGYSTRIACEVKDFDPTEFMDQRDARRSDRFTQFAVASATEAAESAGWTTANIPYARDRVGVVIGSGIGGIETLETQHRVLLERGPSKMSPFTVPLLMINGAAGSVAMKYGLNGPNYAAVSACATGAHAIGEAAQMIRNGLAEAMLAGGSEAPITPLAYGAFACMGALSRRNDDPTHASRPFDADRDGFVIAEGAAVVVLEEWEAATERGAEILAELVGYSATSDAFHLTQPDPEGAGAAGAMTKAIADAGIDRKDVGYINAHGTSTPFNDKIESKAIRDVFGADAPPVSSTKSATGHLTGAAGAIEAVFSIQAMVTKTLPPTINYETADPECDLDYIPNAARTAEVEYVLSNSFGFGGHNACLLFKRAT
ncbi:MAG TPA: beta-ketoacyl-ACP synthase II [Actinomycetota bacterium]|nr:beta-ketoacyl-ACP synthase II [Actinomycetota bacterium]